MSQIILIKLLVCAIFICLCVKTSVCSKVLLKNVGTLTLHQGEFTTGRRNAPIPQLQCVAGCTGPLPSTVQCYNRGSDGIDVQWECKAQLPQGTRFGKLEVLCEGYDYPDDPYILKGSCGLEYRLDHAYSTSSKQYKQREGFKLSDFVLLCIVGLLVYAIYISCSRSYRQQAQYSSTGDDYPGSDMPGDSYHYRSPPPPGFRPSYSGDSCGGAGTRPADNYGGFWTGAAMGGLMGYLFSGNRNSYGSSSGYYGSSQPSYSSSPSFSEPSTSTGFGSTRRR